MAARAGHDLHERRVCEFSEVLGRVSGAGGSRSDGGAEQDRGFVEA